jgi:FAD/FMN-containing dehydrogenase
MTRGSVSTEGLEEFRLTVLGPVLVPGDPGYDEARAAWNGMFDRRPSVIAQSMGVADVQAAIAFARANELVIAVRGGGHSPCGGSTIEGGMLIDLSLMRGVRVDPERRTAVAAAGTLYSEFDRETQVHGLAVTGGMVSHTGIAGLTLGGGMGRFMRKVGLTCDNVLSFDIVTADGEWRHVDADNHPDLFWALRGGGGDVGIVTHFEYQLYPLGPLVYGGYLGWPLAQSKEVITSLWEEMESAPDELQVEFLMLTAPEADFMPAELQGRPALMLIITWMGDDHDEGARYIAPFREKVAPTLDLLGPFPYTLLQAGADVLAPPGRRVYSWPGFLPDLTEEIVDISLAHMEKKTSPLALIELNKMGGAIARVPADETAVPTFRDAPWFYIVGTTWTDPTEDEKHIAWVNEGDAALAPFRNPGRYTNFVPEDDDESIRDAFGEKTYARLAEIKAKYDPDGVFSLNPNRRVAESSDV